MSRLESRGRLLLRAYPQPYRTERGAEILGTLLDAAPAGRSWPPRREAWSLVTCGLRVRAARNRLLPLVTNLRLAALLAAAIWLGQSVALYQHLAFELAIAHQLVPAALLAVCALTACLATASAWFWRRSVTIALAVAVLAALVLVSRQIGGLIGASTVVPPLALAALATGKDRPPRGWLWLPAAVIIAQLPGLPYLAIRSWPFAFLPLAPVMFLGVLGVTLLWFMADARPVIAFGIYLEVICALAAADAMQGTVTAGYGVAIALLAAVLAGASLRVRRQAGTRQV
jgi:hypothetical protein